jgi:hypothetical protein
MMLLLKTPNHGHPINPILYQNQVRLHKQLPPSKHLSKNIILARGGHQMSSDMNSINQWTYEDSAGMNSVEMMNNKTIKTMESIQTCTRQS